MFEVLGKAAAWAALAALLAQMVDWWIGRSARVRLKNSIVEIWARLSTVSWQNIGFREAEFCNNYIARVYGKRVVSLRRLCASIVTLVVLAVVAIVIAPVDEDILARLIEGDGPLTRITYCIKLSVAHAHRSLTLMLDDSRWMQWIIALLLLMISFSVTRAALWVSLRAARYSKFSGVGGLFLSICIAVLITIVWCAPAEHFNSSLALVLSFRPDWRNEILTEITTFSSVVVNVMLLPMVGYLLSPGEPILEVFNRLFNHPFASYRLHCLLVLYPAALRLGIASVVVAGLGARPVVQGLVIPALEKVDEDSRGVLAAFAAGVTFIGTILTAIIKAMS